MEDRYYVVTILAGPENDPDDPFNPSCCSETYEEAISVGRPWAEQGYDVAITTRKIEEDE